MATQGIENNVRQAMKITAVLINDKLPSPETNKYRFYHCHLDWNGLKCKKVDGPESPSMLNDSVLLFVNKYIPERFDNQVLKYKWMPVKVMIEKST